MNDQPDLRTVSEIQLIKELSRRGITLDYITGAYMHMQESYYALQDDIFGSSEAGLLGKPNVDSKEKA